MPRRAARAVFSAVKRPSAQALSPTRADYPGVALFQQSLLHRLGIVAGKGKSDQASITVALGAEPFEPQFMTGGQVL